MSFHTTTMMINWIVTADNKTAKDLNELATMSIDKRKKDPRVLAYVKSMKDKWMIGSKIERLATLGWNEYEAEMLLCEMLENLDRIRKEFLEQVMIHGVPPPLNDQNVEEYEKESKRQRKAASKQ